MAHPVRRRLLLMLALAYALAVLVVSLVVEQLNGGRFDEAMQAVADGTATPETLQARSVALGLTLRLVALSLLSQVFWHAAVLFYWDRMVVPTALFASVLACLRSLGAFTLMGLTWFALTHTFTLLAQIVFMMLGRPESVALALLPGGMMFSAVLYASLYVAFVDSFELNSPAIEAPAG